MTGLDLNGPVDPLVPSRPLRILALSGGGYRGLFTAQVLVHLEKALGAPLADHFELIIGTSAGAILAAGVACRKETHQLKKAFADHGRNIFPRSFARTLRRLAWAAPYSAAPLEEAIDAILGEDADRLITEAKINLAITAVSQTHSKLEVYAGGQYARLSDDALSIKNAILASAAAPTYFPPQEQNNDTLIDGGITANAPELVGIGLLNEIRGGVFDRARVLSIGTAAPAAGRPALTPTPMSFLSWLAPSRNLLLLTLEAQEDATQMVAQRLLRDRYCRVDAKPSHAQAKEMGDLDKVSEKGSATLVSLANEAWKQNRQRVEQLLG